MTKAKLAFITGITGQDGSYLAELLLEKGYKVFGIVRRTSLLYSHTRLDHIRSQIHLTYGDLADSAGLSTFLHSIIRDHPDFEVLELYNLAAQSHVAISFQLPVYTADVDGTGVLRLLEIIKNLEPTVRNRIRFYQAGTSELYGNVRETPQTERTPFNPVSPYAVAKLYGYYITKNYREAYGLYAVNGILFNHESPRRGENFVTMKVVNGVKDIASGKRESISLGNLDSKRDWGHAKDYVRGMWQMLQQDTPDDYVLATGSTQTVRAFVEKAFAYKGYLIHWEGDGLHEVGKDQSGIVRVTIHERFYRPCEVDLLLGDPTKAERALGWKREYSTLDSLIEDMFETQ